MTTNTLSLRLAYHKPHTDASKMSFAGMDPIPVFVSSQSYVGSDDIQWSEIVGTGEQFTVRMRVSPGARDKINHLAEINQNAHTIEDYVALLLFLGGRPAQRLTMVFQPLPGYELDYNGLTEQEAKDLQHAVGSPAK